MPDKAGQSRPVLADIEAAAACIADAVEVTPCTQSRTLSTIAGCDVYLKFENLHFTSSFKERGALNKLISLAPEERERGVIAMSAGNHAQGVAYHAARLGIPTVVVMPEGTPFVKIKNTRRLGAQVVVTGTSLEEAAAEAFAIAGRDHLTFVHPYNDPAIVAGQGTTALEMLGVFPELDVIVVPIGGGGLISGIAIAAKAVKPGISIIGVQAERVPAAYNQFKGTDLPLQPNSLAEGIAVKAPGTLTMPIIKELVDDILLVDEPAIERAVATLIDIEKTVVEGAGAAGLAAVLSEPNRFVGRKVGLVLCGGNIDSRLLASVLTRELARDGRLAELVIEIHDRPGQLADVTRLIANAEANVIEVLHQRTFTDLPAKATVLEVVIETRDRTHLEETVHAIRGAGYTLTVNTAGSRETR